MGHCNKKIMFYVEIDESVCRSRSRHGDKDQGAPVLIRCFTGGSLIQAKRAANTIQSANAGLMLGQRQRRWPFIKPALAECMVCAGKRRANNELTSRLCRLSLLLPRGTVSRYSTLIFVIRSEFESVDNLSLTYAGSNKSFN